MSNNKQLNEFTDNIAPDNETLSRTLKEWFGMPLQKQFESLEGVINNELLLDNNKAVEEIKCPFCGQEDFDKKGLKYHIKSHCTEYEKTDDI